MEDISLKDLLEAGCHFGHKSERWHPKAQQFIFEERDGIHVIDLAKTKAGLIKAAELIKKIASEGGTVLFVGTKRQAAAIIKENAEKAGAPYISHHWIGGFLTNWEQVHKNLEKIRRLTEEEKNNAWKKYPKHERVKLGRYLRKINVIYGGVIQLSTPPQAVMLVDIRREQVAVREARRMGNTAIGLVDTNSDPSEIDVAIPANDDAVGSIKVIIEYLTAAYAEGREVREKELAKLAPKPEVKKPIAVEPAKTESTLAVKPPTAVAQPTAKTQAVTPEPTSAPKKRGRPKKEKAASEPTSNV